MPKIVRKRPNPAVAAAERDAQNAENLAANAAADDKGLYFGQSTANGTKALAQRRRATADKIKATRPNLIETEDTDAKQ